MARSREDEGRYGFVDFQNLVLARRSLLGRLEKPVEGRKIRVLCVRSERA